MTAPFKAAVVQAASFPNDSVASAGKAATLIREAAAGGASLIVFPEAFLGGYPKGASFGTPVGMRKPEGRAAYADYHANAVALDGEEVAIIAEATAATDCFVVIGVIERDGGTVYCTALFFDGASGLIAKHRKLMPTGAERLIWGFGDGSTLPVIDTRFGKVGAVICWENYMPMLRMAMYDQGISVYCAPTADDRDGGPMLRLVGLPAHHAGRLSRRLRMRAGRRSDDGPDARRQHDCHPARRDIGRTRLFGRDDPLRRPRSGRGGTRQI
jgi:nitrilase